MIKSLKKLASMDTDESVPGFSIMKYWHPDAGKKPEFVRGVRTEAEAQEICGAPESSFKEGDTENWYFLGYVRAGSRSCHVTLW